MFRAIVSDYDLTDPDGRRQLRETLDILKASAEAQQDLPFDPSGTGGLGLSTFSDTESASRQDTFDSLAADSTDLQSEFSSLTIDDNGKPDTGSAGLSGLAKMTVEQKTNYLCEMFPSIKRYTVEHALSKCGHDVEKSMDVLLNLAFFEDQSRDDEDLKVVVPKGIEGFADDSFAQKKKRKKRRAKLAQESSSSSLDLNDAPVNKWDDAKKDIDYICTRTTPVLKRETVISTYHKMGASLSRTIQTLAESHSRAASKPAAAAQAAELSERFPSIPSSTLYGLLYIAGNSVSAADELATAMLAPRTPRLTDIIQFNVPRPVLDNEEAPARPSKSFSSASDYHSARLAAEAHYAASSEAFSKAALAYRRSKSDRLMGGAAAYYSAVGRDQAQRARREMAAAADSLVDSQSTADTLDLHGVSVADGVRIAGERVMQWWESLGEKRYAPGGAARYPFRIVTGAGRHSRDGTSRLGPAVSKMLAREGWRFEVGEGVLAVTGRIRR